MRPSRLDRLDFIPDTRRTRKSSPADSFLREIFSEEPAGEVAERGETLPSVAQGGFFVLRLRTRVRAVSVRGRRVFPEALQLYPKWDGEVTFGMGRGPRSMDGRVSGDEASCCGVNLAVAAVLLTLG